MEKLPAHSVAQQKVNLALFFVCLKMHFLYCECTTVGEFPRRTAGGSVCHGHSISIIFSVNLRPLNAVAMQLTRNVENKMYLRKGSLLTPPWETDLTKLCANLFIEDPAPRRSVSHLPLNNFDWEFTCFFHFLPMQSSNKCSTSAAWGGGSSRGRGINPGVCDPPSGLQGST